MSSRAEYLRALRRKFVERGDCMSCGCRPPRLGRRTCEVCDGVRRRHVAEGRITQKGRRQRREPGGWANNSAGQHRRRVRNHNKQHPDHLLLETIIDGPALLAAIVAHGPTCGLCGIHTGFPWEHVGKESGPEVDHILSMWAIINEGRQDWASVSNIRLLCVSCHSTEGIRLKRQDIEERAHMDRALGKDNT